LLIILIFSVQFRAVAQSIDILRLLSTLLRTVSRLLRIFSKIHIHCTRLVNNRAISFYRYFRASACRRQSANKVTMLFYYIFVNFASNIKNWRMLYHVDLIQLSGKRLLTNSCLNWSCSSVSQLANFVLKWTVWSRKKYYDLIFPF
jgi:hypothetical protein